MLFLSMVSYATNALADIPLITDDTGTQVKWKSQIEIFGEYVYDKEEGMETKENRPRATFTYGIIDQVDIALGVPYWFYAV